MSEGPDIIELMFDVEVRTSRSVSSYPGAMTVSAHDVAAALRQRLPGLPAKKLHKLLYYCQGYHLAFFDTPLFSETVSAWDMGPVVGQLWKEERDRVEPRPVKPLDEAQLNTVGYVLSRYGSLSGRDLENLTHNESPWQLANSRRRPGDTVRIEQGWIRDHFKSSLLADHEDDDLLLDSEAVTLWLEGAEERRAEPLTADSLEALREKLEGNGPK
jgi:uncharacterized phage-associated protein